MTLLLMIQTSLSCIGIKAAQLERLEHALSNDLLAEARDWGGRLLLHAEPWAYSSSSRATGDHNQNLFFMTCCCTPSRGPTPPPPAQWVLQLRTSLRAVMPTSFLGTGSHGTSPLLHAEPWA